MKDTTVKYKWYVAVKKNGRHVDIIKDRTIPTPARYPYYLYMYGGYKTRIKALEVAMYHNFYIDSPEPF